MSAVSRSIQATPDLRPFGAAIGTLIVAGAIAIGLATSQAAPATSRAVDTAPVFDRGWSSTTLPAQPCVLHNGYWDCPAIGGTSPLRIEAVPGEFRLGPGLTQAPGITNPLDRVSKRAQSFYQPSGLGSATTEATGGNAASSVDFNRAQAFYQPSGLAQAATGATGTAEFNRSHRLYLSSGTGYGRAHNLAQ